MVWISISGSFLVEVDVGGDVVGVGDGEAADPGVDVFLLFSGEPGGVLGCVG